MNEAVARRRKLAVVATPIGNLEDLSLRAARMLRNADLIAAEDTRSAHVLLNAVDAAVRSNPSSNESAGETSAGRRRVISLFEGNEAERSIEVIAAIDQGQSVVLISEAGTPLVSDPGGRLVAMAIEQGIEIEVVPGPNAAIAALVASGLSAARFMFLGFPPRESGARAEQFGLLRSETSTMIWYEAPDRVGQTFADLRNAFGDDRRASLSRELTKMYEQHIRGTLAELAAQYAEVAPRGECTLVVAGATVAAESVNVEASVRALLAQGLGPKDVAARLMVVTGKPRRQLYQLALSLERDVRK
jgi:16S rRNA (cytidine1402-2'-O)-methyltransferase